MPTQKLASQRTFLFHIYLVSTQQHKIPANRSACGVIFICFFVSISMNKVNLLKFAFTILPSRIPRATEDCQSSATPQNTSKGVFQLRHFLGRVLIKYTTASNSSSETS